MGMLPLHPLFFVEQKNSTGVHYERQYCFFNYDLSAELRDNVKVNVLPFS
jgi:hypothetical protein